MKSLQEAIEAVKSGSRCETIYCPGHNDREGGKASLSVFRARDGWIGLKCHSRRCTRDQILSAAGINLRALAPPEVPPPRPGQNGRQQRQVTRYRIQDSDGKVVAVHRRVDNPDGTKSMWWERADGRKGLGGLSRDQLPLFGLERLGDSVTVVVTEGERAAEALQVAGVCAVGTVTGANGVPCDDSLRPIMTREIILWPDQDDQGIQHMFRVGRRLVELGHPEERIRVVVWGANKGDDAADAMAIDQDPVAILRSAIPWSKWISGCPFSNSEKEQTDSGSSEAPPSIQRWIPFPVDLLPYPYSEFVAQTAAARQCDPAAVALPLLSALASAIGTTRVIRIWPDWLAPSVLWTMIICSSGTVKSPAFDAACGPLKDLETEARKQFEITVEKHEQAKIAHEAALADWKRLDSRKRGDPPLPPDSPVLRRFIIQDTTIQALAYVLRENPRGVLLSRDELSGWVRSFDQFTKSTGADVARWLEIHRAQSISVDRVKPARSDRGNSSHIHVPRAAVSICGTIQDDVAKQVFNHEHQANGLFARFLFARPPEPRRRWRCSRSAARFADVVLAHFKRLQELNPPPAGEEPMAIGLSTEAESVYEPWFNAHNELREGTDDNLVRSILAKIEEVPARLALVLELAQAKDPTTVRQVSQETMHRAIGLANWFRHEGRACVGPDQRDG